MNDQTHSILPAFDQGPLTMSSLEIAELTGKRHDHVMRDVRNMLGELGGLPSFGDTHTNPQNGQEYPIFRLPKRECIILVSGYDVTMRARIIDRWMELEVTPKVTIDLNDPAFLRGTLLTYTEKVIALQAEIEGMKPAVEVVDRLIEAHGSLCITDAAKSLQVPPQVLFRWLRTNGWIYKRAGTNHDLAYQTRLATGCLVHKVETYERSDGTEGTRTQVRVTPKGLTVLAKAFPPAVAEMRATRRSMVAGIGALIVAAATALVPTHPAVAAVPVIATQAVPTGARLDLLKRYVAFLAHEHRAALKELQPAYRGWNGDWVEPEAPMFWFPDAPDIEAMVKEQPSSHRAMMVLAGTDPDPERTREIFRRWQAEQA